jgi:CheY-like chemotaxis protein
VPSHKSYYEGKRVLIVDDNKTSLDILKMQLNYLGFETLIVPSGAEALEILNGDTEFNLVLTDLKMPDIDGIALAKAIKNNFAGLQVILLCYKGYDLSKKFPGLFAAILTKPIKQHLLFKEVNAVLKNEKSLSEQKNTHLLDSHFSAQYPFEILVVEDNPVNQKIIQRVLNKLGYETGLAANGIEALRMMDSKLYNLIMMDVQMPEMDGLEATRRIRRGTYRQPYIIALTANAMPEDRDICLKAGMDDYLAKPMELDKFMEALRNASEKMDSNANYKK